MRNLKQVSAASRRRGLNSISIDRKHAIYELFSENGVTIVSTVEPCRGRNLKGILNVFPRNLIVNYFFTLSCQKASETNLFAINVPNEIHMYIVA